MKKTSSILIAVAISLFVGLTAMAQTTPEKRGGGEPRVLHVTRHRARQQLLVDGLRTRAIAARGKDVGHRREYPRVASRHLERAGGRREPTLEITTPGPGEHDGLLRGERPRIELDAARRHQQ